MKQKQHYNLTGVSIMSKELWKIGVGDDNNSMSRAVKEMDTKLMALLKPQMECLGCEIYCAMLPASVGSEPGSEKPARKVIAVEMTVPETYPQGDLLYYMDKYSKSYGFIVRTTHEGDENWVEYNGQRSKKEWLQSWSNNF
jgi:hypothetical protein